MAPRAPILVVAWAKRWSWSGWLIARDKPSTFGGGMKRRLNIACALVHDPDVLVFDEPTVGVDPQSRNAIFDNLEVLRKSGKGTDVHHALHGGEAERLCDRIVIVDHGRVVANDELGALLRHARSGERLEIDVGQTVGCTPLALPGVVRQRSPMGAFTVKLQSLASDMALVLAWCNAKGWRYVTSIRCVPILRMSSSRDRPPTEGSRMSTLTSNFPAFKALVLAELRLYFSSRRTLIMNVDRAGADWRLLRLRHQPERPDCAARAGGGGGSDGSTVTKAIHRTNEQGSSLEITRADEAQARKLVSKLRAAIVLSGRFGHLRATALFAPATGPDHAHRRPEQGDGGFAGPGLDDATSCRQAAQAFHPQR